MAVKRTTLRLLAAVLVILAVVRVGAAPQEQPLLPPLPYDYSWKVEDAESNNYYGQQEAGATDGSVAGSYHVLLPDGRLMTVSYTVAGDSGYVAKITYEQNAAPFAG